jgi:hypothetical protein
LGLFRLLDHFDCEIARKAMLAQPDAIRSLGLNWFYSKVYEHREPGGRFMPHGVPTWFFYRGKRSAQTTQMRSSGRGGHGKDPGVVPAGNAAG